MLKRNFSRTAIAISFLFLVSQHSFAQTTIFNDVSETYLEKLINSAKANYPRVKGMDSKVIIAKSGVKKAQISWFDIFTFSYVYQPHSANFIVNQTGTTSQQAYSYFNGIQVGLFLNLGNYLQKTGQLRDAKEQLKIAGYEQDEYLLTLATEVKKRYYSYVQSVTNVKLQTQSADDAEQALKNIKHKFEKGEETYDNFNKAQITVTTQMQSKILAEANYLTAKAELEELLGDKIENIK